ncbi:MAG: MotA/TolQ/ExbB proton channel family protein [Deltaproteobacteria bacterium]|nr:MotA/TolQ/ExbB proton channel family protein [Deltaproteobacteria bacterium]MBW2306822.1 MotA/TolQ/ExbB proton channel family protein [Deltaproteobacteria bacterium]
MIDVIIKGGVIMYPLLACSIVSLTLIIERLFFWWKAGRERDGDLVERILTFADRGEYESIAGETAGSKDFVVRMLVCGLVHREYSLENALEMASAEEVKRMRRNMTPLDTIITLAPLLGILGTVLGIIDSFHILGQATIETPQAVTAGISQALITTAVGLVIALLTLIAFNYFNAKIEDAISGMEKYGTSLEIVINRKQNGEGALKRLQVL